MRASAARVLPALLPLTQRFVLCGFLRFFFFLISPISLKLGRKNIKDKKSRSVRIRRKTVSRPVRTRRLVVSVIRRASEPRTCTS